MNLFLNQDRLQILPVDFETACAFVNRYHRHHTAPQGHKRSIGCYKNLKLLGVAIMGRPVSRHLDDGYTWEVTRVCTLGERNVCSKLYSGCVKLAKHNGMRQVITYILEHENGSSLKASNFKLDKSKAGGTHWTGSRSYNGTPCLKQRWIYKI